MADTFTPEQITQILEEFFKVVGTRKYIGERYVPIFGRKGEESIQWDNSAPYEPLTIVLYQGNSYTSRQYVPIGIEITNQEFWVITGNYNAQVEAYHRETIAAREIADNAITIANNAQTDIDTLLPKADFSAENTVKKYIDETATVQDGSITTIKLADGAVTGVKIADNTIPDSKLVQTGGVLERVDALDSIIFYNNGPTLAWEIGSIMSNGVDSDITTAIRTVANTYYEFSTGDVIKLSNDAIGVEFTVAYYQYHEPSQTYQPRGRSSWGTSDYTVDQYVFVRIAMRYSDQRTVTDTSLSQYIVLPEKTHRRIVNLYQKSTAFTGDSIAYGAGFTGGYGKLIANRNTMQYQNVAVSGATISDTTSIQSSNVCIVDTLSNITGTPDYIILEGGCNDASYTVEVGEYSRYRIIPSEPVTFYQYLDELFGTALAMFPSSKIGFVITHATQYAFSAADNSAYYNAIVKECEKWGISYCDLNTECPPFALFSAEGNASLYAIRNTYTLNGDGWHPNESGYKTFYVDKIEAWMETL